MGFRDFSRQAKIDQDFLAVPERQAGPGRTQDAHRRPARGSQQRRLRHRPVHESKFKAAGLETEIVPYQAWLNLPQEVFLEATNEEGKILISGPSREHVDNDPYQDDPRVLPAFHGSSPGCDVTADAVYVNYGRPEDFKKLEEMHISVAGKMVVVRYGMNFRGVKVYLAQQRGAAGVIIYSDPADDGYFQGDKYPHGPWRPDTGVQRGSVQYMFKYPGDATTRISRRRPGLAASRRLPLTKISSLPTIPSMPLSYHDAAPILDNLGGPVAPREWQGALPFSYHVGGAGQIKVHMRLKMDFAQRTVWDVIGKIPGSEFPDEWVVAGNHRDAWVYGAVDPGSGTAAMLEAVHGVGGLLAQGWKPRRTLIFCSWDAEEEGLIGSTEWAEEHAKQLAHAVVYINTDASVSGLTLKPPRCPRLSSSSAK